MIVEGKERAQVLGLTLTFRGLAEEEVQQVGGAVREAEASGRRHFKSEAGRLLTTCGRRAGEAGTEDRPLWTGLLPHLSEDGSKAAR